MRRACCGGGAVTVCIVGPFPCPWPNLGQGRVGPSESGKAHWAKPAGVKAQQRAIVAAAFGGPCTRCGQPWTVCEIQPGGRGRRKKWIELPCSCRAPRRRHPLPPHGPEHPVDVLFVRIPRAGAPNKGLDDDGAISGAKAIRDEVTVQLWPRDPVTRELRSEPDDSARWLRFSVRQRPHRKAKPPRKLPPGWVPGPPDPSNQGTELVEIWIAPREDCRCDCGELRQAARRWYERWLRTGSVQPAEIELAKACEQLGEPCGCGRSMLPIRWPRGELC